MSLRGAVAATKYRYRGSIRLQTGWRIVSADELFLGFHVIRRMRTRQQIKLPCVWDAPSPYWRIAIRNRKPLGARTPTSARPVLAPRRIGTMNCRSRRAEALIFSGRIMSLLTSAPTGSWRWTAFALASVPGSALTRHKLN